LFQIILFLHAPFPLQLQGHRVRSVNFNLSQALFPCMHSVSSPRVQKQGRVRFK